MNISYRLVECLKLSDGIMCESLALFNKVFDEDCIPMSEMFKMILDTSKTQYKMNNQDEYNDMPVILFGSITTYPSHHANPLLHPFP
jgi:hypothetical protein